MNSCHCNQNGSFCPDKEYIIFYSGCQKDLLDLLDLCWSQSTISIEKEGTAIIEEIRKKSESWYIAVTKNYFPDYQKILLSKLLNQWREWESILRIFFHLFHLRNIFLQLSINIPDFLLKYIFFNCYVLVTFLDFFLASLVSFIRIEERLLYPGLRVKTYLIDRGVASNNSTPYNPSGLNDTIGRGILLPDTLNFIRSLLSRATNENS